jgi:DNA-binding PadR family transcriptional regulator
LSAARGLARSVPRARSCHPESSLVRLTRPTTLVLLALSRGLRHGFEIAGATALESGTVYPILRRLDDAGCVRSRWEPAERAQLEGRPPRRYYELTGAGAEALQEALARHPDAAGVFAAPRGTAQGGTPQPLPA